MTAQSPERIGAPKGIGEPQDDQAPTATWRNTLSTYLPTAAERKAAREAANKAARHKAIPGGRFRSGPHKDNRAREADRIDGYDRDDLGESPYW
jgi:hypothetical protein